MFSVTDGEIDIYNAGSYWRTISAGKTQRMLPVDVGTYEVYAVYKGSSGVFFSHDGSTSNTVTFETYKGWNLELFADKEYSKTINVGDTVQISNTLHPIDHASGSITYTLEGGRTRSMAVNDYVNMTFTGPGTYVYTANYEGDSVHGATTSNKITIKVLKLTPSLSLTVSDNATIGSPITVKTTLTSSKSSQYPINGNITYIVNGIERSTLNIGEDFTYTPYTSDDLKLTVRYNGNRNYTNISVSRTINAEEASKQVTTTSLEIDKTNINFGESVKIKPIVKDSEDNIIEGTVTLTIGPTRLTGQSINQEITYTPTSSGELAIYAIYSGNEKYEGSESDFQTLTVNKESPNLNININPTVTYVDESVVISASISSDATDNMYLLINNNEVTSLSNTKSYTFNPTSAGKYNITVKYNGDKKYNPIEKSLILDVISEGTFILKVNNTNELIVYYGDTIEFESIISPENENGIVKLYLNGIDTGINNFKANSKIQYQVNTLGELIFNGTYQQNSKTLYSTENLKVYVNPLRTDLTLSLNKDMFKIGEYIEITNKITANNNQINSGTVIYYLNDEKLTELSPNEKFTFKAENVGKYTIKALYEGEDIYASSTDSISFVINNETSNLTNDDLISADIGNTTNITIVNNTNTTVIDNTNTTTAQNNTNTSEESDTVLKTTLTGVKLGDNFILTLKDENNNPLEDKLITFALNGNTENLRTDNNGQVSYSLDLLDEGDYQVMGIFQGDLKYLSSRFSSIISITNVDTSLLQISKYYSSYGSGESLKGKLLNSEGNIIPGQHITLTLTRVSSGASKVYDVVSDYDGDFSLPINLAPGFYSVTGVYDGLDVPGFKYSASNLIKSTIIVTSEDDDGDEVSINTFEYNNSYPGDGVFNKDFNGTLTSSSGDPIVGYTLSLRLIRLTSDGLYGASKVYNTVTDYRGVFSLQIALAPGNYKVISSFAGSDVYGSAFSDESLIIRRS